MLYSPSGGGDDLVVAIGGGVVLGEAGLLVVMFPVDSVCVRMVCSTLSSLHCTELHSRYCTSVQQLTYNIIQPKGIHTLQHYTLPDVCVSYYNTYVF